MSLKHVYVYLRYERVILFWMLQISAILIVLVFGAWVFLQSALAEAIGLTRLQERGQSLQSAIYWQFRAWKNADLPFQDYSRHHGYINHALPDGRLMITISEDEKFVFKEVSLANLTQVKVDGLAAAASLRKQTGATFDLYPEDRAVIWINKNPWNVDLIADGLAKPTNNPQTNVVDLVFAEYFWSKFKGESN